MKKSIYTIVIVLLTTTLLASCSNSDSKVSSNSTSTNSTTAITTSVLVTSTEPIQTEKPEISLINESGKTVETRISTPEGFKRTSAVKGSLLEYMRNLELKPHGSPILYYDGNAKGSDNSYVAVFDFDVGERDLQQCADCIMRIYSEYFLSRGEYDKIKFHLTNGFLMDYNTWRNGNRISVSGNNVSWVKKSSYDDSYESFREYLNGVMCYAGTISLVSECTVIDKSEFRAGDMILKGSTPGHCVLAIDEAENDAGEKCYLLAQGYMPAQSFHILTNPNAEDENNMWYYEKDLNFPIVTPGFTFNENEANISRWNGGF